MILVTGGTGLVGSNLLLELICSGEQVKALKRRQSNCSRVEDVFSAYGYSHLFNKIEWVDGDVLNIESLRNAMHGVDFVYHCAAIVSFDPRDRKAMLEANIQGTKNILSAIQEHNIKKLCFVSSVAALGRTSNDQLIDESTQWETSAYNSTYAESKYYSEQEVWKAIRAGLSAVIVNPSIILGYGNTDQSSLGFFSTIQKGMPFYTNGINGFVDVRDVVKAMTLLMKSDISGERFILSSENISYRGLFNQIADALGKKRPYIRVNSWIAALAWRAIKIKSFLTNSKPFITKESASTAQRIYRYSSKKIIEKCAFHYIPIKDSVRDICKLLLQQKIR